MIIRMTFKFIIYVVCVIAGLSLSAQADYRCVCSVDGAIPVFRHTNIFRGTIGFLFENDCREYLYPVDASWNAVVFMHQVGFVLTNVTILQTCRLSPTDTFTTMSLPVYHTTTSAQTTKIESMLTTDLPSSATVTLGTISAVISTTEALSSSDLPTSQKYQSTSSTSDIHTTTSGRTTPTIGSATPITTTKITDLHTHCKAPTSLTTVTSSTTTPQTSTQSTTTTTPPKTTPLASDTVTPKPTQGKYVPEGHIELCPNHVKGDVNTFGGYLGQYGEYCLELVTVTTQWHNAQRHCTVAAHGSLVDIQDPWKQDYVVRFLANHTSVQSIWLGLTDSKQEGASAEGHWTWVSGDPVSYTNFGPDYNNHTRVTHQLDDCVIMKQCGEWTDVQCGVALVIGTGFGESHNFICQYNVTSKPFDIFHELGTSLVG